VTGFDSDAGSLEAFLRKFWEDRDVGAVQDENDYAALFPDQSAWLGDGGASAAVRTFGRYRIVRALGRGGQGVVHLAEDTVLHRRVALKVLTGIAAASSELLERFRREAEIASRLDHVGLCTVYDSGVVDGTPYIAMRYIEGPTLAELIRDGAASENGLVMPREREQSTSSATTRGAIVALVEKVARALHVAHEAGVVHRDVKPANIMLGEDGEPVLCDFGVAADDGTDGPTLTRTGDVFGTPAYMSPEQLVMKPTALDRRTDVFSLGVVLYECLTLRRPFDASTREAMYEAIRSRDPVDPRRFDGAIPRDLVVVLETALEKDRERRYATALELGEELARVLAHEPIHARPAGLTLRLRRWAQRHPGVAVSVTLLALALVGALFVSLAMLSSTRAHLAELRVRDMERRFDLTFPLWPERTAGMDRWIDDADELRAIRPRITAELSEIESQAAPADAALRDRLAARSDWLSDVRARIDALGTARAQMTANRDFARAVDRLCLEQHAADWQATIDAIGADPAYRHLRIEAQRGLVPLGRDPHSKLFEFAHPQSGAIPQRDPATGRLGIADDTCIVLVLLPGGSFHMGASDAPGSINHDPKPQSRGRMAPIHEVELDPFFIGKFELTQSQWLRLTGANPSSFRPRRAKEELNATLRHPVETISWHDCMGDPETETVGAMPRAALTLPTEAQWEYACRAGTHTLYSTGTAAASLQGFANIQDSSSGRYFVGRDAEATVNDGHLFHAAVGSFAANQFGLHDMHGNVWEICRDWDGGYELQVAPGDGARLVPEDQRFDRTCRSSSFDFNAPFARSALRNTCGSHRAFYNMGARAARPLTR